MWLHYNLIGSIINYMKKIPKSAAVYATKSVKTLQNEIITRICCFECYCALENSLEEIMSKIFEFYFLWENLEHWLFQSAKLRGVFLSKNDGLVKIICSEWLQYSVFQVKLYRTNPLIESCHRPLEDFVTVLLRYNWCRNNCTHLKCTIWWVLINAYTSLESSSQSR